MKKRLLLATLLWAQFIVAQESDIKKSIGIFFEGLQTADTIKMQSVCNKHLLLHTIYDNPSGNKFEVDDMSKFYKSIASIPKELKIEERLLGYKILIDGPLAHVWTPYEFYINGKLSHSGVNSFEMIKENGMWKIVYIIDTRRMNKK